MGARRSRGGGGGNQSAVMTHSEWGAPTLRQVCVRPLCCHHCLLHFHLHYLCNKIACRAQPGKHTRPLFQVGEELDLNLCMIQNHTFSPFKVWMELMKVVLRDVKHRLINQPSDQRDTQPNNKRPNKPHSNT